MEEKKTTRTKKQKESIESIELPKVWRFKNPTQVILLGREEITSFDLDVNQELAQILIDRGLGDLICQE